MRNGYCFWKVAMKIETGGPRVTCAWLPHGQDVADVAGVWLGAVWLGDATDVPARCRRYDGEKIDLPCATYLRG